MTSACGCSHDAPEPTEFSEPEAPPTPWWRDREVLVPVFSGIALAAAFLIGLAAPDAAESASEGTLGGTWILPDSAAGIGGTDGSTPVAAHVEDAGSLKCPTTVTHFWR